MLTRDCISPGEYFLQENSISTLVAKFPKKIVHRNFEMSNHRIESFIEILFSRRPRYPKRSKKKKPIEFSKISRVWWTRKVFYRFFLSETEDYWSKKLVSEGVLRLIARVEAREKSERANEARDKIKLKQKCLPRHSLYLLNPSLTLCNPDDDYCDESVKLYQRNYLLTGYGW